MVGRSGGWFEKLGLRIISTECSKIGGVVVRGPTGELLNHGSEIGGIGVE